MLIEIATFRLAAGVEVATFLEVDSRAQVEFFSPQPGFARRTTARGDDGSWLVVTLWGSERDADAAAELAKDDPVAIEFDSLIDVETLAVKRYAELD